jgi:hypothetical protein
MLAAAIVYLDFEEDDGTGLHDEGVIDIEDEGVIDVEDEGVTPLASQPRPIGPAS